MILMIIHKNSKYAVACAGLTRRLGQALPNNKKSREASKGH